MTRVFNPDDFSSTGNVTLQYLKQNYSTTSTVNAELSGKVNTINGSATNLGVTGSTNNGALIATALGSNGAIAFIAQDEKENPIAYFNRDGSTQLFWGGDDQNIGFTLDGPTGAISTYGPSVTLTNGFGQNYMAASAASGVTFTPTTTFDADVNIAGTAFITTGLRLGINTLTRLDYTDTAGQFTIADSSGNSFTSTSSEQIAYVGNLKTIGCTITWSSKGSAVSTDLVRIVPPFSGKSTWSVASATNITFVGQLLGFTGTSTFLNIATTQTGSTPINVLVSSCGATGSISFTGVCV